ncbi:MAG TPA: cytochrome c [Thermoanaerobaculia bacterium]|nr:cytochrome c [Thermoanaerobaculia bacterium]
MFRGNALVAVLALLLSAGCYQKMGQQPRYDPLEPSDFFADGMSARPRVAGTVARGELHGNPYFETGMIGGQTGDGFPFPVTPAVVERGEERYNIYCAQCHGRVGDGNGMIPSRGFSRARSFHTETMRTAKAGHFFDVMTNGFGAMPPYRNMVPAADRWAIIAYIRALQLSQNATMADVPADARATLEAGGGH